MAHIIVVQVRARADGGWRVQLGDRDTRPAEGDVPAEVVQDLTAMARALQTPTAALLLPGRDAARSQDEERVGVAITRAVCHHRAVADRLAWLLGRHEHVVFVVDAVRPQVRALPWELMAHPVLGTALEVSHGPMARQVESDDLSTSRQTRQLRVLRWCPTPQEPRCSERLRAHQELCASLSIDPPSSPTAALPAVIESVADVLVIVCHGAQVHRQTSLLTGESDQGAATIGHRLAPALRRVQLVILEVCEGGAVTTSEIEGLASRLTHSGAPAVVAPLGLAGLASTDRLTRALITALAEGEPIYRAIQAARRAVRELGLAHRDSRWANYALYVGHAAVVLRRCAHRTWRPEGWPCSNAEVSELLRRAHALASERGAGFVGLEHLFECVTDSEGRLAAHARFAGPRFVRSARERLDSLALTSPVDRAIATPRLTGWADKLPSGANLEQLWGVAFAHHPLANTPIAPSNDETLQTRTSSTHNVPHEPASTLWVLGGPEDGRRLDLQAQQVLGRAGGDADVTLYERCAVTDPYLSRKHLRWLGDGTIELLRKARITRDGVTEPRAAGAHQLMVGDVLQLSRGTWLQAL